MVQELSNISREVLPNGLTIITEEMQHIRDENSDDCFPAKVGEHVAQIPPPCAGDHHYRWSGEMRKGTADGDIDEEKAERGVLQHRVRLEFVKATAKQ